MDSPRYEERLNNVPTSDDLHTSHIDDVLDARLQAERLLARMFNLNRPTQLGRYHLRYALGRGGMGCVYLAEDQLLERDVAIKVVRIHNDAELERALAMEARAMAKLSHPNIVQIYDLGFAEGMTFIVMEYIDGVTLQRWLAEQPWDYRNIVDVFISAGEALAAAHVVGIVHRDFKPSNVMVDRAGRVRVMDFGLASRDLGTDATVPLEVSDTQPRFAAGTPRYMAPEQFGGQWCDARSDQYSFCVALYEALYGEHPFGVERDEIWTAATRGDVRRAPDGSGVPWRLRMTLVKDLAPDPRDRSGSMQELLLSLVASIATPPAGETQQLKLRIVFSPDYDFDDFDEKERKRIQDLLRIVTRDPDLRIEQVEAGSVVLTLSVSERGAEVLKQMYDRGELGAHLGGEITELWASDTSVARVYPERTIDAEPKTKVIEGLDPTELERRQTYRIVWVALVLAALAICLVVFALGRSFGWWGHARQPTPLSLALGPTEPTPGSGGVRMPPEIVEEPAVAEEWTELPLERGPSLSPTEHFEIEGRHGTPVTITTTHRWVEVEIGRRVFTFDGFRNRVISTELPPGRYRVRFRKDPGGTWRPLGDIKINKGKPIELKIDGGRLTIKE